MSERRRLGVQDALWLEMDRPNNLMVVDSLLWTEEPMDWDRFKAVTKERLWDRYPAFRSTAVRDADGVWYWEEHPEYPVDTHIRHVVLPDPGDERALQELIASQRTVPLDRTRPLWCQIYVDNYKGGSAVVTRTHHAIADGIRMVQLAMSMFDATPEGGAIVAPPLHQHAAHPEEPGRPMREQIRATASALAREVGEAASDVAGRVSDVISDPVGVTSEQVTAVRDRLARAASSAAGVSADLARTAVTNPVGAAHTALAAAVSGAGSVASWLRSSFPPQLRGSGPLVDFFSAAPGDVDIVRKLLLGTRNDVSMWTGTAGTKKAVAWSDPLPLADVKAVAKTNHATVNDVLVTSVAGTLCAYLEAHHAHCASVNWMIPVNLKPLDTTLPDELGNSFSLVQLEMPTDDTDPLAVLDVVKRRMARIKGGHEAAVAFRVQELISGLSKTVYQASVDLLANRAVGVLTNVPGPPIPVYAAGRKVTGIVGWAPLSGNEPMSFTIYSYDGKVFVGIACDAGLVPDHEQIVDGFAPAFYRLASASVPA